MSINQQALREVSDLIRGAPYEYRQALTWVSEHHGIGPRHLVSSMGVSLTYAREILALFRKEGVCDYGHLTYEYDGTLGGAGYWLDRFGIAVRKEVLGE